MPMINRKWFCYQSPSNYTLMLKYGDYTFTTQIPKNEVFHTLSIEQYMQYHIVRLNVELMEALLPLTR